MIEKENAPVLTRRTFLLFTSAALPLASVSADSEEHNSSKDIFEGSLPEINPSLSVEKGKKLDKNYLVELLSELQEKKTDPQKQQTAVMNSLSRFRRSSGGEGTAFQIDESGYYLTARHVVVEKPSPCATTGEFKLMYMYDPYNKKQDLVTSYAIYPEDDLAIAYAPTGERRQPVKDLHIETQKPNNGTELTLVTLDNFPKNKSILERKILQGKADTMGTIEKWCPENVLAIPGLKSFDGASGSPIMNADADIVGVLSGSFTEPGEKEPAGAIMQGLKNLDTIPEDTIYTLNYGFYLRM